MKSISVICITLFFLITSYPTKADIAINATPFDFATTLSFNSEVLHQVRSINVYLPQSYEKNTDKHYPVIYLLDGSKNEDFIHIAGLVQFANFSWIKMLPDTIVVGISNIDRKHDFTTKSNNHFDQQELPSHGGAEQFIHFLQHELKPLIAKEYRTNGTETLIGQSLGGLLATEILYNHSALFDHYLIISPSLWWDDEALLKSEFKPNHPPKSVYIAVGKEGHVMERVAKELYKQLAHSLKDKSQVKFQFFSEHEHGDTLHLAVYDAFKDIDYAR